MRKGSYLELRSLLDVVSMSLSLDWSREQCTPQPWHNPAFINWHVPACLGLLLLAQEIGWRLYCLACALDLQMGEETADFHYSGNASLSPDRQWLLIDNLAKGFDLYSYPRLSLSKRLLVERQRAYVYDGLFLESGQAICCGSDHGRIYMFSLQQDKFIQTLQHGSSKSMIQVLDVSTPFLKPIYSRCCRLAAQTVNTWSQVGAAIKMQQYIYGRKRLK